MAPPQKRIRADRPGGTVYNMRAALAHLRECMADAPRKRILELLATVVDGFYGGTASGLL